MNEIKDSLKWVIENPMLEDELSNGDLVKVNNSCDLSVNECECLLNYITQLEQENQSLKDRIEKAIEYIEKRRKENVGCKLNFIEVDKTLEILKGDK